MIDPSKMTRCIAKIVTAILLAGIVSGCNHAVPGFLDTSSEGYTEGDTDSDTDADTDTDGDTDSEEDTGPDVDGDVDTDADLDTDNDTDADSDINEWLCNPEYYGTNDGCDCGCGIIDPDCGNAGCAPPSCYDSTCDYCWDDDVEMFPCIDVGPDNICPDGAEFYPYAVSCEPYEVCNEMDGFISEHLCDEHMVCCITLIE